LVFPEGIPYQRNKGFGTTKLGVIFNLNQEFLSQKTGKELLVVDFVRFSWNQIIQELKAWQSLQIALATPKIEK